MDDVLDTRWMTLKPLSINRIHSEQLCWDNPFAQAVAAPLFQAGILIAAIYQSPHYVGAATDAHWHSFGLLLQGSMHVEQGGLSVDMQPGDLSYIRPRQPYSRTTRGTPSRMIYFMIGDLPEWAPLTTRSPYVRRYASTQLMFLLLRGALDGMRTNDEDTVARARDYSGLLLCLLRNEMQRVSPHTHHHRDINTLSQAIIAAPERDWTASGMAKEVKMSVRQMTRLFKAVHGISPHQFVVRQRLLRAMEALDHTDTPIDGIAASLGYSSLHSFTRLFTANIGVSPGQFRRKENKPRGVV